MPHRCTQKCYNEKLNSSLQTPEEKLQEMKLQYNFHTRYLHRHDYCKRKLNELIKEEYKECIDYKIRKFLKLFRNDIKSSSKIKDSYLNIKFQDNLHAICNDKIVNIFYSLEFEKHELSGNIKYYQLKIYLDTLKKIQRDYKDTYPKIDFTLLYTVGTQNFTIDGIYINFC